MLTRFLSVDNIRHMTTGTRQIDPTELLARIERHLAKTGISATEFGRTITGSGTFMTHLRRGSDPRLSTVNRVLAELERTEAAE